MSIDTLKEAAITAQRIAPSAPETKAAQRAYQHALNELQRDKEAKERIAKEAEDKARMHAHDFSRTTPRLIASTSLGVYPDFATVYGIGHAETEWAAKIGHSIMLGYRCHFPNGEPFSDCGKEFPCKILSIHRGAYVSDQPRGRSGWHLIAMVELPPELQYATNIERE
jgi:hypothetical protein